MYKKLENAYKVKSTEIRFRKTFTNIYFTLAIIILITNLLVSGNWLAKTIVSLVALSVILPLSLEIAAIITSNKILTKKSHFKNLFQNFANKDITLLRNYLKKNDQLDSKSLEIIINHYANKPQKSNNTSSLLTILLAIASLFASSLHQDGIFNLAYFVISITTIIIFLIIYYIITSSQEIFKFYTGTDDLYETLEDFTTQLYLETMHKDIRK